MQDINYNHVFSPFDRLLYEKNLRIAAYARVSTDSDDQRNSFESQKNFFENLIHNQENWTLVNIYFDEGVTGTSTKKRGGFNAMIDDAMSGKIDFILTKEVSRFARNTVDTLAYARQLKSVGVGIYFVIDNINSLNGEDEFRLAIMASTAQEESRKTSNRVKWGQQRRMENGVVFGNKYMLGYRIINGELIVEPEEAEIVKKIFLKYAYEKKGTYTISKELKKEGVNPPRAEDWSEATILKVLQNEKYVGDLLQKKYITIDYLSHKKVQFTRDYTG